MLIRLIRPRGARALVALMVSLVMASIGCSDSRDRGSHDQAPALAALEVSDVSIDAFAAPRDGNPLVAGEEVRLGLRIRGGQPPYGGTFTAVRQGTPLSENQANPITAQFAPDPDKHTSAALDMALMTRLDARAPSGVYRLRATVTDARGRRAGDVSKDFTLIGDSAGTLPAKASPPFVQIVDVAGRRRESFVRGEPITIQATIPGQTSADIALHGPTGELLAQTRAPLHQGRLQLTMHVPRLALSGAHTLAVTTAGGTRLTETMTISSPPFAPAHTLVVDDLAIYGGEDMRAPRAGVLERAERLTVQARVGGGRVTVSATLRLFTIAGTLVDQAELGRAEIAHPGPRARVYVQGTWQVPAAIEPGRYQLQVTATEGDYVSSRNREVLLR